MKDMPDILARILAEKRKEIAERRASVSEERLAERARSVAPPRDFVGALRRTPGNGIRLIAEYKRASPSKGPIREDLAPETVAEIYAKAGASAVSVLTDKPFFAGSLDDLAAVRSAVGLPILRKDFILDAYQLLEARAAGADAVLLIAAALSDEELKALHEKTMAMGMAALVEVHDGEELERALAVRPALVGINNRNLRTFEVNLETTIRLRPSVPEGVVVVGESGIRSRADALRLEEAGVDAMLVGESLMRRPDPGEGVRELLGL